MQVNGKPNAQHPNDNGDDYLYRPVRHIGYALGEVWSPSGGMHADVHSVNSTICCLLDVISVFEVLQVVRLAELTFISVMGDPQSYQP